MENCTKLRILYLYQHLVRHTDEEHTLSTAELIRILKEEYNLNVSRNTISDDLAMLNECGLHIEHFESTQNKYYYDGHIYELPELKILVDAISSSKFITQRKSDELIAKLLTLTNSQNAAKLRRHIYTTGRVKSENEQGYYCKNRHPSPICTQFEHHPAGVLAPLSRSEAPMPYNWFSTAIL